MQQSKRTVRNLASPGEDKDGNQLGVSGGMIAGLKKAVFNGVDFGAITFSTYAVQP